MIPRHELPDDATAWTDVEVSFPRLANDSPLSCPDTDDDIFDYVQSESADTEAAERERLRFVRTARVADADFWLWEYTESDGELCYVTFQRHPDGSSMLGLASSNGLSHEQYLLAEYYDEVYWS